MGVLRRPGGKDRGRGVDKRTEYWDKSPLYSLDGKEGLFYMCVLRCILFLLIRIEKSNKFIF